MLVTVGLRPRLIAIVRRSSAVSGAAATFIEVKMREKSVRVNKTCKILTA